MRSDLRQVLHEAAAVPRQPLDLDAILARSRRRRRRLGATGAAGLVLACAAIVAVVAVLRTGPPDEPEPAPFAGFSAGWTALPSPPEVRYEAAVGWTGDTVLMWSGSTPAGTSEPRSDGYAFDARANRWTAMPPSPLTPRMNPAAVWTGRELLVWGGFSATRPLADGGAYDPLRRTWRRLPAAPIDARAPLSVWTGEELIVWGTAARRPGPIPRDGAAYRPATDSWRPIAAAPIELTDATAVWTGREMVVFGAALGGNNNPATPTAIGAAYDPATDTWRRLPDSTLSPQASTAAWDGRDVVAWDYLTVAAAYDAGAGWRRLPAVPLPESECVPRSVPLGGYVFGDHCGRMVLYDGDAGRWQEVTRDGYAGWWFELVAAGPAVIVLGRDQTSGRQAVLAYRPPAR